MARYISERVLRTIFRNKKLATTIFCLIALYTTWGMVYLSIRFALESIPPIMLSGTRYVCAGTCFLIWSYFIRGYKGLPSLNEIKIMAGASLGMVVISGAFLNLSETYVASGTVALILGATPLMMVIAGWLFAGDQKPNKPVVIGLAGGFLGIVILAFSVGIGHSDSLIGVLCVFISMSGWVGGSLFSRKYHVPYPIEKALGFQMLMGGAAMLCISFLIGEYAEFNVADVTLKSFLSLLHLIFFGTLVGFTCYVWLLYNTPTPIAVSYAYAEPVVAVILGVIFAGEHFSTAMFFACLLIIISVFFVMRRK